MQTRDYSLMGKDGALAVESGLANAKWYATDIPRKEMKEFIKRSDGPAIRDTLIWLAALFGFASLLGHKEQPFEDWQKKAGRT